MNKNLPNFRNTQVALTSDQFSTLLEALGKHRNTVISGAELKKADELIEVIQSGQAYDKKRRN